MLDRNSVSSCVLLFALACGAWNAHAQDACTPDLPTSSVGSPIKKDESKNWFSVTIRSGGVVSGSAGYLADLLPKRAGGFAIPGLPERSTVRSLQDWTEQLRILYEVRLVRRAKLPARAVARDGKKWSTLGVISTVDRRAPWLHVVLLQRALANRGLCRLSFQVEPSNKSDKADPDSECELPARFRGAHVIRQDLSTGQILKPGEQWESRREDEGATKRVLVVYVGVKHTELEPRSESDSAKRHRAVYYKLGANRYATRSELIVALRRKVTEAGRGDRQELLMVELAGDAAIPFHVVVSTIDVVLRNTGLAVHCAPVPNPRFSVKNRTRTPWPLPKGMRLVKEETRRETPVVVPDDD